MIAEMELPVASKTVRTGGLGKYQEIGEQPAELRMPAVVEQVVRPLRWRALVLDERTRESVEH